MAKGGGKPGEYSAGRGTPARTHLGESKDLSVGETARVGRILAHETSSAPFADGETGDGSGTFQTDAYKRAAVRTNEYSDEIGEIGEEV